LRKTPLSRQKKKNWGLLGWKKRGESREPILWETRVVLTIDKIFDPRGKRAFRGKENYFVNNTAAIPRRAREGNGAAETV